MNKRQITAACGLFLLLAFNGTAESQIEFKGTGIVPNNPNSMDSITYVRFEPRRFCIRNPPHYRVSMQNNEIVINFGLWDTDSAPIFPAPPDTGGRHIDTVDLGRLPAGAYTLTTIGAPCTLPYASEQSPLDVNRQPFTVTDGRTRQSYPKPYGFSALDVSGHWWDERDSGWGLFIWQDRLDNTLAAWFTYTPDGKPAWYVFQPIWFSTASTRPVDVWQTSKPPGTVSPPVGTTKLTTVGTADLSFYFGEYSQNAGIKTVEQFAKFTFKLGDAPAQTRTLMRFKAK